MTSEKALPKTPLGWSELLRSSYDIETKEQASEFAKAAENILEDIVPGIRAVSMLLWRVGFKDENGEYTAPAALLLASLADLVATLSVHEVNATRFGLNLEHGYSKWGEKLIKEIAA